MWLTGSMAEGRPGDESRRAPGDQDAEDLRLARESTDETVARQAASRLLSRYQDHVYEWCYRYTRDHDAALDLAQEVMLSAYKNLHRFQPRAKFSTWLFVVTRNKCISEMRKRPIDEVLGIDLELVAGGKGNPETILEDEEGRQRVIRLIRQHLSRREQEAIYLRCFERMPVDGITEVLEIEEASGARGILQSARRKLKAALADGS